MPSNSLQTSQDQVPDASSETDSPRTKGICIELPSRAAFLKSRPEFDTASVIAISASQISDCPHTGSEIDLPPSQFFVVSSQPSQDIVVADSQPLLTGSSTLQHFGSKAIPAGISQTTIPDSQEFLDDFTEEGVEVPGTAQELDQDLEEEEASAKPSNKDSSGSTIPSHQPNINQVSFAHDLHSIGPEHQLVDLQNSQRNNFPPLLSATADTQASSTSRSSRLPFDGGFLTQPAFDPGEFNLSAELKSQSTSQVSATAIYQPGDNPSLEESHQPAQRVSPLSSKASQFLTQTDIDFYSASEDYEVVPDSSVRNSGQTRLGQQASLH